MDEHGYCVVWCMLCVCAIRLRAQQCPHFVNKRLQQATMKALHYETKGNTSKNNSKSKCESFNQKPVSQVFSKRAIRNVLTVSKLNKSKIKGNTFFFQSVLFSNPKIDPIPSLLILL